MLKASGGFAYITDAENRELVTIDLARGAVSHRTKLAHTPVEMAVTTGGPSSS